MLAAPSCFAPSGETAALDGCVRAPSTSSGVFSSPSIFHFLLSTATSTIVAVASTSL